MDSRRLRNVLAVMEHGSLSRAAERLGIAQPALGTQLRALEDELGVRLVDRHSRGVTPTAAGDLLRTEAGPILDALDGLERRMKDLSAAPRGRVVLGVTPSTGNLLAPALLRAAADRLPGVSLSLVEAFSAALVERVAEGSVDLAVCSDMPQERRGVRGETLASDPLVFVESAAAGRVAGRSSIPLAEVARVPLVVPALEHEALRRLLDSAASAAGVTLAVAHEVKSVSLTRSLLADGTLGAVLPYGALIDELRSGRLVAARIVEPEIARRVCLVYTDRRVLDRAERGIRDMVHELMRAPPGEGWEAPPGAGGPR